MSDRKLLKKVRDGDREALSEMINQYYSDIFRFCLYMIQNQEDAYDITQETFLKFIKYGMSYRRNNLKGYLLTIARNLCFDYFHREKENICSYEAENENGSIKISGCGQNTQECRISPGNAKDKLKELEDYLYLKELLNNLSPEIREVVILRAYEEVKFKDIAKMMNCSLSTAKSRYRIGIQQMKNMIKEGER